MRADLKRLQRDSSSSRMPAAAADTSATPLSGATSAARVATSDTRDPIPALAAPPSSYGEAKKHKGKVIGALALLAIAAAALIAYYFHVNRKPSYSLNRRT